MAMFKYLKRPAPDILLETPKLTIIEDDDDDDRTLTPRSIYDECPDKSAQEIEAYVDMFVRIMHERIFNRLQPSSELPSVGDVDRKLLTSFIELGVEPDALRRANPIPIFDNNILFEAKEHVYTVRGEKCTLSATGFIHSFFEPFDSKAMSHKIANSPAFHNKNGKYYHKSPEDIQRMWEDTAFFGTAMHQTIEWILNGNIPIEETSFFANEIFPLLQTAELRHFLMYYNRVVRVNGLRVFRTELRVCDFGEPVDRAASLAVLREILYPDYVGDVVPPSKIAGSVDILYRKEGHPDHELVMHDWKRTALIRTKHVPGSEPCGRGACKDEIHCNYCTYALQLSFYQYIIERHTSFRIIERAIVVFYPTNNTYEIHYLPDKRATIVDMIEEHISNNYAGAFYSDPHASVDYLS